MNKLEILKSFDFFNNSDEKFKSEILNESSHLKLQAGTTILYEGDLCQLIPLVGQGKIRVFKLGDKGREVTLYHINSGESCILSTSSILGDTTFPANATVEVDTEIVGINISFFKNHINKNEEFRNFIYKLLAIRLSSVLHLLEEIIFNKLDSRLAQYLIKHFENNNVSINKTHEQVANDLGSSREVISRLLKQFELSGAVKIQRGKIESLNLSKLQEFSEN